MICPYFSLKTSSALQYFVSLPRATRPPTERDGTTSCGDALWQSGRDASNNQDPSAGADDRRRAEESDADVTCKSSSSFFVK